MPKLENYISIILQKINNDHCIETADRPYYYERQIKQFLSYQKDWTNRQLKNFCKLVNTSWRKGFNDYRIAAKTIETHLAQQTK